MFRDVQYAARQEAFRSRLVDSGVTAATVRSPEGLEIQLFQALHELHRSSAVQVTTAPAGAGPVVPLREGSIAGQRAQERQRRETDLQQKQAEAERLNSEIRR